eukprot:TRINITY_DN2585_c0_g5_i1.p1 TRINITY_DN2585_c0_g5~~TRINITY_DN2585_c0_g5_i1.p1  ORF type:complete len:146 (-),score=11.71 TRINITY_DN2585_c0_g5_i1:79-516(-)
MSPLDVRLLFFFPVALLGIACGQCTNDDYRILLEGTTAFSVSKSDMVCRCPAGIVTNGTIRAASFVGSGAALTNLAEQSDVDTLRSQVAVLTAELAAAEAKLAALTTTCAAKSAITAIDSGGHAMCSPGETRVMDDLGKTTSCFP